MIVTGQLLLPTTGPCPGLGLVPGGIRIDPDSGTIAEVFDMQGGPAGDLGGHGAIIAPGFVDAHVHLPQFDSIGVHGRTLLDWLDRVIFPAEVRWSDANYAAAMAGRVAERLLSCGTTSVCAYATVHHESARRAMAALSAAGVSGLVGQVLMDRNAPPELTRPAGQLLAEAARLERVGRVAPIITPRFAVSCSEELLRGAGALADSTGQRIQTHLAETLEEGAFVASLFGGLAYTEVYRRCGLVREGTIFAHAIHLSQQAIGDLAKAKCVVAHCPTANLFLQSGRMNRGGLASAGIGCALGSDVAGGHEVSMVRVAQAMIETVTNAKLSAGESDGQRATAEIPTASQAWWQITAGNAGLLGLDRAAAGGTGLPVGRLAAGYAADLVVIRPGLDRLLESPDPLGALLWGWDDRWITQVITGGRVRWSS